MGGHGSDSATAPTLAIHHMLTGTFYQTRVTGLSRLRHEIVTRGVGLAIRAICAAGTTISQRTDTLIMRSVRTSYRPRLPESTGGASPTFIKPVTALLMRSKARAASMMLCLTR